jgi:hypothetical protein
LGYKFGFPAHPPCNRIDRVSPMGCTPHCFISAPKSRYVYRVPVKPRKTSRFGSTSGVSGIGVLFLRSKTVLGLDKANDTRGSSPRRRSTCVKNRVWRRFVMPSQGHCDAVRWKRREQSIDHSGSHTAQSGSRYRTWLMSFGGVRRQRSVSAKA